MKQYKYTLFKQDGTIEDLGVTKKYELEDFYRVLDCSMIELIPKDYVPEKSGHSYFYGDEEGRFKETNHRNPHFKHMGYWDVVGNILKEEVYHE